MFALGSFRNNSPTRSGANGRQHRQTKPFLDKRSQVTNWHTRAANALSIKPIHTVQHSGKLASFGNFTYMGRPPLCPERRRRACPRAPRIVAAYRVRGPAGGCIVGRTACPERSRRACPEPIEPVPADSRFPLWSAATCRRFAFRPFARLPLGR